MLIHGGITSSGRLATFAVVGSYWMSCRSAFWKTILPGVVETALITNLIDASADPAAMRAGYESMSPMKRMARVEEVAALVAFLASDEAAFISGGEYLIDGASTAGMNGL